MTELLLKNKKLLNDNIIKIVYKNENLTFENTDIITIFNSNPSFQMKQVDLNDKVILYEFYEEHHEDINLLKQIINDFIQLIIFLNNNKNNEKISDKIAGAKEIFEVFGVLNDIKLSDEFKEIFNEKNNLTINKTTNLFIFYLRLIFDKVVKDEFKEYQDNYIEEKKEEKIRKYFSGKNKNHLIEKGAFINAIRLFITLYLNNEKEKEEKNKK
jgi:deoxycytidylate deaminase